MELQVFAYACLLLAAAAAGDSSYPRSCRCVPDQWEGILASLDREFDMKGGHSGAMETKLFVSYDYINKLFSMTDLNTGYRAIADYQKGYKYVTRAGSCRRLQTNEQMKQMCLPEHAEYMGEFTLGTDVPVDMWQFHGPFNVSMKTTVVQKNCMPVTEELYMARGGLASLTSSMYLDVTTGIRDSRIFDPPANCRGVGYHGLENELPKAKRAGAWSLLSMLKPGNIKPN